MDRSAALPSRLRHLLPVAIAISASITGCGRRQELETCNINERSCQEDVYYAVVRARGDGFDPFDGVPPIRTITKQQYEKELFPDGLPKPPPADDDDAGVPDPPPETKVEPWDVSLQWLGLLKKSVSSGQAQAQDFLVTVAAFYTWDTQTVTIVTNPDIPKRNPRYDTVLLAHELVHAFQDNDSDLTLSDGTVDGNWASNAYIEGEARMYEYLIGMEIDDVSPYRVDWSGFFHSDVEGQRTGIVGRTSRLYSTWWFLYSLGTNAIVERWLDGGNASVRYFARHAPSRTIDYLAALEDVEVTPAPPLACRVELPGSTFQYRHYNRLGALNFYAFLLGGQVPEAEAWRAAVDWRDDQLFVYFDPEPKTVAMTWRLRFATRATAELTVKAAETLPMLRAERQGNDVVIVGSEESQADWPGAVECGP
jgi:hypothetical protein